MHFVLLSPPDNVSAEIIMQSSGCVRCVYLIWWVYLKLPAFLPALFICFSLGWMEWLPWLITEVWICMCLMTVCWFFVSLSSPGFYLCHCAGDGWTQAATDTGSCSHSAAHPIQNFNRYTCASCPFCGTSVLTADLTVIGILCKSCVAWVCMHEKEKHKLLWQMINPLAPWCI